MHLKLHLNKMCNVNTEVFLLHLFVSFFVTLLTTFVNYVALFFFVLERDKANTQ